MFKIKVSDKLLDICEWTSQNINMGQRGTFDGTAARQRTGIIGQNAICKLFGADLISTDSGFDGGTDLLINGKRVDVKTMGRKSEVKKDFACNFVAMQEKYPVDYYLFTSLHLEKNELTVCGVIKKELFMQRKKVRQPGSTIKRNDGSAFEAVSELHEVRCDQLIDVNNPQDILRSIF